MPGVNGSGMRTTSVAIGGLPIAIASADAEFIAMLERRYAGFIGDASDVPIRLEVDIVTPTGAGDDEDLRVGCDGVRWTMTRGDFRADWDPVSRRGRVRQAAYPYAIDSVMRIVHSLVLAERGGFLLHAASAIRGGRAFIFSGVSGAGKTTISRLAPADVTLLTDEISYIRKAGQSYSAFGTPFAGELGRPGENLAAPIAALYFLVHGPSDLILPIDASGAARRLLRNILFFANDQALVEKLFAAACDFVSSVPVYELTFRPTAEVWGLIR
jgi:hypothetical protein